MRRAAPGQVAAVLFAAAVLLSWVSIWGETESELHIVPLQEALSRPAWRDVGVFLLSADDVLIEVAPRDARRLDISPSVNLGARGTMPLYMVQGRFLDEVRAAVPEEEGLDILHADPERVIFRAGPDTAYRLDIRGYGVARIGFTPLSRLMDAQDMRPVHEGLLAARPLTPSRLGFMKAMSESVSADSLFEDIYFLSYDDDLGEYRSRFAARHDLDDDITPVMYDMLEGYVVPVGGSVHSMVYPMELADNFQGHATAATNVWGHKPGTMTSARYIICAHFDATASRDDGFDTLWVESAAPGSNDNATGAAGVLECARLMAPMQLDFGVTFMLFSAEENLGLGGMQGSQRYVETLSETDSIIGVINLDMFGYSEDYKKGEISYGWRSEWLTAELLATAESLGLETGFEGFQRADLYNSDHSSFWRIGVPALMLNERNQDDFPIPIFPYYHTSGDTLGNLDMGQVRDNIALVVGYFSRFADIPGDSLSDLEVTPQSIEFSWAGRSTGYPFVAGEDLTVNLRALNIGGSMPDPAVYTFKVWQGDGTGPPVHEEPLSLKVAAGGVAEAGVTFETAPTTYGDIEYTVSLLPVDDDVESDVDNNRAAATVTASPITTKLENLHVYPNPVERPDDAVITVDILTSQTNFLASFVIEVLDVTGRRLLEGEGLIETPELNLTLTSLSGSAYDLAPGLYVCILKMNVRDETADLSALTKFAVVSGPR